MVPDSASNTSRPVVRSQTFTFRSAPVEARCWPSGWKATATTPAACAAGNVRTTSPVLLSRILMVPSPHAAAIHSPSGLNARPLTWVLSRKITGSTRQSRLR